MTILVGAVDGDEVILGADSRVTDMSGDRSYNWGGKVWHAAPGLVMGGCGDLAPVQRVRYVIRPSAITPPLKLGTLEAESWIVRHLVTVMKETLDGMTGADFLLGLRGRLWTLDDDLALVSAGREATLGSGAMAARGALYVTSRKLPESRVTVALEAAAQCCDSCGGEFVLVRG